MVYAYGISTSITTNDINDESMFQVRIATEEEKEAFLKTLNP
jgi:hypothetical protein